MVRIGTRGSALALWQTHWVADRLRALGTDVEIITIRTTGDKVTDVPLAKVGTKGLFTKELEDALLRHEVDLAVHSLKDMPTSLPDQLVLAAIPEREDPRDALVGMRLDELPLGAVVGTSSLRRAAQLHALRPDLRVESIRGNLDTRLAKLRAGQAHAIVLAAAGLHRLGWADQIAEYFSPEQMCPAVGQGALALETRHDGGLAWQLCQRLNHEPSAIAVRCERAALSDMGGGCQVPIGAHAHVHDDGLTLYGAVFSPDGRQVIQETQHGSAADPEALGSAVAQNLLARGGEEILSAVYGLPR